MIFVRRLVWLTVVVVAVIFGWSRSLLLTSAPIDAVQRQTVRQAVEQLEHAGFSREVLSGRTCASGRRRAFPRCFNAVRTVTRTACRDFLRDARATADSAGHRIDRVRG
jgi:hypothetical protein